VQGVGGRLALAILSILSPDELARAVSAGDKAMIARASGVGPKLAQRIANELQGKLGLPAALGPGVPPPPRQPATNDALSALANLGFKPAEASQPPSPPRTSTRRFGPRRSTSSSASRRRARICACSSMPPRRAARRSTMCCSSARRGSARPRWRRSSRASWASASAPPPGR
jgi:hypothetical protein